METWYPKAKRLPITTGEFWKVRSEPILAIVEHITAGNDSRDYLQNANNGSSVHFLIRNEGGGAAVVYQFMPIQWAAWGNGIVNVSQYTPAWLRAKIAQGVNPNMFTISVEHESPYPMPHPYTEAMIEASIELDRWILSVVPTISPTPDFIIGHYMIDGVNRPFCPGGPGGKLFPFDRIILAVKGGSGGTPTPPPQPPPVPVPGNQTAIEKFHDTSGGFGEYGPPIEVDGAGRVKERTVVLPDITSGGPFQAAFYAKGVVVWRADLGASRYNSGSWLLSSLIKLGEL